MLDSEEVMNRSSGINRDLGIKYPDSSDFGLPGGLFGP